jgi:hypothetical protein
MSDLRLAEFWSALKSRLNTARMTTLQGGAARIYTADDFPLVPFPIDAPHGRTVILPVTTLWPQEETGLTTPVAFLVRCDRNWYVAPGYNPLVPLEAAQAEVLKQLDQWVPTGLPWATIITPVFRRYRPQRLPLRDDEDKTWFLSTVYQFDAVPAVMAA